jgi:hypothetical protein
MRRRLRYLRTVRELSYRDLGGLMFDLHRFGGRRDELLIAKLTRLGELDRELRAIEKALDDREPVTVLREAGVLACLRCAAIHASDDNFCPHCGLSVSPDAERPLTTAPEPPPGDSAPAQPPAMGVAPAPGPPGAPASAALAASGPPPATGPPAAPSPGPPTLASPAVAAAAAPAAAASTAGPPTASQPPADLPPTPRQPPVAARTSPAPTPQADGDGSETGEQPPDGEAPPAGHDSDEQHQAAVDETTQVIRRPERPEGSTAG